MTSVALAIRAKPMAVRKAGSSPTNLNSACSANQAFTDTRASWVNWGEWTSCTPRTSMYGRPAHASGWGCGQGPYANQMDTQVLSTVTRRRALTGHNVIRELDAQFAGQGVLVRRGRQLVGRWSTADGEGCGAVMRVRNKAECRKAISTSSSHSGYPHRHPPQQTLSWCAGACRA